MKNLETFMSKLNEGPLCTVLERWDLDTISIVSKGIVSGDILKLPGDYPNTDTYVAADYCDDCQFSHSTVETLSKLQRDLHEDAWKVGWWHQPGTGLPYIPGDSQRVRDPNSGEITLVPWDMLGTETRNLIIHYWPIFIACKMSLVHSELSEAVEAHRKSLMDDKLPLRLGFETENADAMIRQFDLLGAMCRAAAYAVVDPGIHEMNIGESIIQKRSFNAIRPDHKPSARASSGGKAY